VCHVSLLIAEQKQLQKHNMQLRSKKANAPFPKGMQTWLFKLKPKFGKVLETENKFGKHVKEHV
jgi:hypothetical protein